MMKTEEEILIRQQQFCDSYHFPRGEYTPKISDIYAICKRTGYRLVITMMVEHFYNRMVARGATIIDFETVEINDDTIFGRI